MPTSGTTISLSYVVPAHNCAAIIEATVRELGERFSGGNAEILVVENGSTDETPEVLARIAANWAVPGVEFRSLSSEKGLGNALKLGLLSSRGEVVVTTADDLPFGFDEYDAGIKVDLNRFPVVVGSKAHPQSQVGRGLVRWVATNGFLVLRTLVLGMRTRDPQGTFVLNGDWAREVAVRLEEKGFLLTTELIYIAERQGVRTVEVPVSLRASHGEHGTRIKLADVWYMGVGLVSVRRRHRKAARRPATTKV
ncbi:glycosyltransferase family 2 protein [Allokutzneria multivorans]|uniref:Glycosyltransferase family 2 protein n=1 Tax=Allokutzneria multivorans TaxID=1142134 RepID=A0ABP7RDV9_9PSEU